MNPRVTKMFYTHTYILLTAVAFCVVYPYAYAATDLRQMPPDYTDSTAQPLATLLPENVPTNILLLSLALARALTDNPKLAIFSQEIRAREAATLQANLLPNPDFAVQSSNFGNHIYSDADGDVITIELSQLIELGGKRVARTEVAQLNQNLANWDYKTQRINVLTEVTLAYIQVLAAQQREQLAEQLLDVARKMTHISATKVRLGQVAPLEETKAKIVQASAWIERQRAQKQLLASRQHLASSWGSTQPTFTIALGHLQNIQQPPLLQDLLQRIKENPDLARWATEISQRRALITMEKAQAIPDITFNLGTNTYLDGNNYNLNAGFSMPLPLFDRNQGSILAAERHLDKAIDEQRSTQINIMTSLTVVYQQLAAAYVEVTTLKQDVIPGAEEVFNMASRGYQLGKFNFLDVLDAQRTLVGVKTQYIQAQADYHLNVAKLERLIGGALNPTAEKINE